MDEKYEDISLKPYLIRAEIDLDAIAANVGELKKNISPSAGLMAVVKADGYGHGALETSMAALKNGASSIGVARIDEGAVLREAGIKAPVLIFGHTPRECAGELIEYNLMQTVSSRVEASDLSSAAARFGKRIAVHIKIDTGMGRLGLLADLKGEYGRDKNRGREKSVKDIKAISTLENLELKGIYTHFAKADERDKTDAKNQFQKFMFLLDRISGAGITGFARHAANSAAIIELPHTHLDMVRAGIAIYGLKPSDEIKRKILLEPAMSLKTMVIHCKKVGPGFAVSYGSTYKTVGPTTIATVSAGYGDGVSRLLSNRGEMLVRGRRAPIAGRVCMDQTMLDVGHIPGVRVGDEVVAFGRQGDEEIGADEIARLSGTINYEIVSTITARVPRVYIQGKNSFCRSDNFKDVASAKCTRLCVPGGIS